MRYSTIKLPCTGETVHRKMNSVLGHSFFGFVGARPLFALHTAAEHQALKRWAAGRSSLAEIGVAEGVSGLAIREAMDEHGMFFLIDPFHLSRIPALNFTRRAAHRAVESCRRGRVRWIEKFSYDAVKDWNEPVDFLMIDGDHSEAAVRRDWEDWSGFLKGGGAAVFHDARTFEGGCATRGVGTCKGRQQHLSHERGLAVENR
jgi:predicted O-methyltransferase YrrM